MNPDRVEPGRGEQPDGPGRRFPTRFGHNRRRFPRPSEPPWSGEPDTREALTTEQDDAPVEPQRDRPGGD